MLKYPHAPTGWRVKGILQAMKSSFFGTALVLGLLSAIGPFAIDMYLPALPSIGQSLGASMGAVQASLMAFFISLGIGQIIYGPVSDMVGRKPPLYFGLVLFAVASVGCALAPDIETLVVLRFIQGLGACAGMVVPRAIVRDLHTGVEATRLTSLLMLVFSVSPILAPLAGSVLIEIVGWRSVFWAVMVAAVLGIVLLATSLPETRPPEERVNSSVGSALAAYGVLLRDKHFLGLVFIGAFGISSALIYPPGSYADTEELIETATAFANEVGETVYVYHDWSRWLAIHPCAGSLADAQLQAHAPVPGTCDYATIYTAPADLPFPAWEALAHARAARDGTVRHNTE